MFGLNKIFYGIIGVFLLVLLSIGGYLYIDNKRKEAAIARIEANNVLLKEADAQNQRTIERIVREQEENLARVELLNRALEASEEHVRDLQNILNKHDLEELAFNKPEMIERRMNDGTREVFDRLRNLTRN